MLLKRWKVAILTMAGWFQIRQALSTWFCKDFVPGKGHPFFSMIPWVKRWEVAYIKTNVNCLGIRQV
jgi:hypothetical protein